MQSSPLRSRKGEREPVPKRLSQRINVEPYALVHPVSKSVLASLKNLQNLRLLVKSSINRNNMAFFTGLRSVIIKLRDGRTWVERRTFPRGW